MSKDKLDKDTMREVINRIKNRRLLFGYSFQDLADRSGISKSTLQRYETGNIKSIPISKLTLIAEGLNTTAEYLMGWSDDPNNYKNMDNLTISKSFRDLGFSLEDQYKFDKALEQDQALTSLAFSLTAHEGDVIAAYRKQTDMQPAVDRLLGVSSEIQPKPQLLAAHNDDNDKTQQELMNKDIERIKNMRKK